MKSDSRWQDPSLIKSLLTTPGRWAVVGLSANSGRTAYGVAEVLVDRLGMDVVPVHPRAEPFRDQPGYASLADVPGPIDVVDFFLNSERVGAVVDQAVAEQDRLSLRALWLQVGVIDQAAAERAGAAGLEVVMDACPAIEAPRLGLPHRPQ